jgi:hypothetical protein
MNKHFSNLNWVLGTIFVGALGSGLWELFLSDLFFWFGNFVIEIASLLSEEFKNGLYDKVSNGSMVAFLRVPVVISIGLIVAFPFALLFSSVLAKYADSIKVKRTSPDQAISKKEVKHNFRIALAALMLFFYVFVIFQSLYMTSAANFVEKSLDIVAPHITENEYLKLRSQFRSVKSAQDFYNLYDALKIIEKTSNVELPEFEPI